MSEFEDFCRAECRRRGIDPDTAVRVANSEGGLTEPAREGSFNTGHSFWAFQLHYGGIGFYYFGTTAGMGNQFTAITGWKPGQPEAWRDAMRYALDAARKYGWGAWYGAAANNITGFDGIDRSQPWSGTPDGEWDYKNWNGEIDEMPAIPQDYIDKFSLGGPYDLRGLIDNLEGVAHTMFDQGKAEGLSAGRIPDRYVVQFGLRDDHDIVGLIDNLEGVGNTKYQQGLAEGRAQAVPQATPA